MMHLTRSFAVVAGMSLALAVTQSALAQDQGRGRGRGGGFGFGGVSVLQLAQMEKVQGELKLSDEQKGTVRQLTEELNSKTRGMFQNAQGNFAAMRTELAKLNTEFTGKLYDSLQEGQRKRLQGIYAQVAGVTALLDAAVAKEVGLTDDQRQRLEKLNEDYVAKLRESFRDAQDLSREQRAARGQEMREQRDKEMLAVLSDAQKQQFEALKGEKFEVDFSQLPRPQRRN